MSLLELKRAGGTTTLEANSVCKVSVWYIPGGFDYDRAEAIESFFADKNAAERFVERYQNPPEMAVLIPLN